MSDYDREAPRPLAGTVWAWEPRKPHAASLIEVTKVRWNGEWLVKSRVLAAPDKAGGEVGEEYWNDLSRFWEACHRVFTGPGPSGAPGPPVTRRGAPQPSELAS